MFARSQEEEESEVDANDIDIFGDDEQRQSVTNTYKKYSSNSNTTKHIIHKIIIVTFLFVSCIFFSNKFVKDGDVDSPDWEMLPPSLRNWAVREANDFVGFLHGCIERRSHTDVDTVDEYLLDLQEAFTTKENVLREKVERQQNQCQSSDMRNLNGVFQQQKILGEYLLHVDSIYQAKLKKKEDLKLEYNIYTHQTTNYI